MTEVQELVARLRLKDEMSGPIRKVRAGISGVSDALNSPRMRRGVSQIGTGLRNSALIGAAGVGVLASQVAVGLNSLVELEQQQAQTNAVIKSTGGVAKITGKQVTALAEKYEGLNATIGDETIRAGENMILTFTNIRGKAFEPTLKAVLDMNTALGKGPEGLTNTAILVGKALNDPTKGLTALRRVGVAFTASQVKKIKSLQEEGKLYQAQKIILKELNKEFGGSFLAQGDTTAGKVAKFKDAIEDLQRALATALLPAIGKVSDRLSKFLGDPKVVAQVEKLGDSLGDLFNDRNLDEAGRIFGQVFQIAKDAAPTIAASARITADVVKTAVSLFRSLPPELQRIAIGAFAINKLTGGLVTNLAGGLIGTVVQKLFSSLRSAVVNVNGAVVNVNGAGGGIPGALGGGAGAAGGAAGGLTLGALATTAAVGVVLVGGTALSLQNIADATAENSRLAELGLTNDEIIAQRYYNANKADQATIAKRLYGLIPSKADFNAGIAKLDGTVAAQLDSVKRNVASNERQEAIAAADSAKQASAAGKILGATQALDATARSQLGGVISQVQAGKNATVTATGQVKAAVNAAAAATRSGASQTVAAVRAKRLSVTIPITTITRVTVRGLTTSTAYANKYGATAS